MPASTSPHHGHHPAHEPSPPRRAPPHPPLFPYRPERASVGPNWQRDEVAGHKSPASALPLRPTHTLAHSPPRRLALPLRAAAEHGSPTPPPRRRPPRRGGSAPLCLLGRGGDGGRELRPRGEQPAEPGCGGAAAQAAGRRAGEAVRRRPNRAARAGQHRHQGGGGAAQRAARRGGVARVQRAPVGAPERGGLLPGDADPRHRRGQRGVRVGQERHGAAGPGHDQRARRAGQARTRQRRQGVVAHRAHRARVVVPVVGGRVPGGPRAGRHEAHARLPGADRVVPHGERLPVLRLLRRCRRHLPRLRAVPPQRRRARPRERTQVLQPPRRAARRRVRRGQQARELQCRARGGLRDRVAVQGRRQRGRRFGCQRRGLQRQPGAPRALWERRHPSPPRRRHRRVPLRALQREPEARAHLRAQLRRLLPEPAEGVRRRLRPRRRRRQPCSRRRRPGQRRPRVAGERRADQRQHQREPAERGEGDDRGGVVRGERHGRGAAAPGGAGLRVRPRRRGLQGHPARRGVLRAQHHGRARLLRLQRLLPAQGTVHRDLRLRRRRLRRQPGTNDGQVRPPIDGLN